MLGLFPIHWAYIIAGTVLIALGSLTVTYGWSLRSSLGNRATLAAQWRSERTGRRIAMLQTLRSEWAINDQLLQLPSFVPPPGANLDHAVFYPRILLSGVQSAVASGLFIPPNDTELFNALMTQARDAEILNARLVVVDGEMGTFFTGQGHYSNLRTGIRDGGTLKNARQSHAALQAAMTRYDENAEPFGASAN